MSVGTNDLLVAYLTNMNATVGLQVMLPSMGVHIPSDIQRAAIPLITDGRSVALQSFTGSGKVRALLPDMTALCITFLHVAPVLALIQVPLLLCVANVVLYVLQWFVCGEVS